VIVFELSCRDGHRFEGWFASSDDFAKQHAGGLVGCPSCGSREIAKAPMAPAVPMKGNRRTDAPDKPSFARGPLPPEVSEALRKLALAQAKALENSTWVGDAFAEQSRAMHYGERDPETIHGRADAEAAIQLVEEGIAIAPLPFPVTAPDELN
jgi:hypothetical protein